MSLRVLCFVFLVITPATADLAAEQRGYLAIDARVERHLASLQDDSPTARQRAVNELMLLASETHSHDREAMIQAMLRYSLWSDLETQLAVDRLVDEIRILDYQEQLERLLQASAIDEQQTSPLSKSWNLFSARASQDEDARAAFRQIALKAGPSLQWRQLHRRAPQSELDIVLISHLGCLTPETPRLFLRQSHRVFSQLVNMQLRSSLPSLADANGRIIGRLIDRTLLDNPYGWTIPERLHLALAYQRDRVAATLCHEVLRADHPLARDLAVALLAWPRISPVVVDGELVSADEQRVVAALDDRRVVCVSPERLIAEAPNTENQVKNQNVHRRAIIRTRVQDVAGWVLIQGADIDVRDHGMSSLRADPVWGIELSSIGFATDRPRERFLGWVQAQVRSTE